VLQAAHVLVVQPGRFEINLAHLAFRKQKLLHLLQNQDKFKISLISILKKQIHLVEFGFFVQNIALPVVEFADGAELGEGGERFFGVWFCLLLVLLLPLDRPHFDHLLLGAKGQLGHRHYVPFLQQVHVILLNGK